VAIKMLTGAQQEKAMKKKIPLRMTQRCKKIEITSSKGGLYVYMII